MNIKQQGMVVWSRLMMQFWGRVQWQGLLNLVTLVFP